MNYSENAIRAMIHAWLVRQNFDGVAAPASYDEYLWRAGTCTYSLCGDTLTVTWRSSARGDLFVIDGCALRRLPAERRRHNLTVIDPPDAKNEEGSCQLDSSLEVGKNDGAAC